MSLLAVVAAMTPLERAQRAQALLNDPMLEEAFQLTRMRLIEGLEALPTHDTEKAEDFRKCLKLLKGVRQNLESAVNSGKLEAFRLEEAKKRKDNPLRGIFR
jgi:maltooligosyltrehalose synthase